MKKTIKILICVSVIFVATFLVKYIRKYWIDLYSEDADNQVIGVTMSEAICLAENEANKYYEDLQLLNVTSYDNDDMPDESAGEDGTRQLWYVDFGNVNLNYVSVLIKNGKIEDVVTYDENANGGEFIDINKISLTTQDAVKCAIENGLVGGNPDNPEEWVSGYNFII